jgi:hypothetical protein
VTVAVLVAVGLGVGVLVAVAVAEGVVVAVAVGVADGVSEGDMVGVAVDVGTSSSASAVSVSESAWRSACRVNQSEVTVRLGSGEGVALGVFGVGVPVGGATLRLSATSPARLRTIAIMVNSAIAAIRRSRLRRSINLERAGPVCEGGDELGDGRALS